MGKRIFIAILDKLGIEGYMIYVKRKGKHTRFWMYGRYI
jgi:hypothetical protein